MHLKFAFAAFYQCMCQLIRMYTNWTKATTLNATTALPALAAVMAWHLHLWHNCTVGFKTYDIKIQSRCCWLWKVSSFSSLGGFMSPCSAGFGLVLLQKERTWKWIYYNVEYNSATHQKRAFHVKKLMDSLGTIHKICTHQSLDFQTPMYVKMAARANIQAYTIFQKFSDHLLPSTAYILYGWSLMLWVLLYFGT